MAVLEGISNGGRFALLGVTIFVLIGFLYAVHYWNEHYRKHQPNILANKPTEEEATTQFEEDKDDREDREDNVDLGV